MFSKWIAAASVAGLAALALAVPALGDTQELDVRAWQNGLGTTAETEIDVYATQSGAATAKVTVYAPTGYNANLSAAVGTKLGTADSVFSEAGATKEMTGDVLADDPTKYASDPTAQACAPGTHAAVWTLTLGSGADAQTVHFFVDPATGSDTSFASYVLQACFLSPDVPSTSGGAAGSAKFLGLLMDLPQVFANPAGTGSYTWRALVEPYVAGTSTPSAGGTVEVHSIVLLPQTLTFNVKQNRKRNTITLSGRLMGAGSARGGVNVRMLYAPTLTARAKSYGVATTKANGTFSLTKAAPKKTIYLLVYVNFYVGNCSQASITTTVSCVEESIAPPPDRVVKIVVPKKK
jgi:hypothetical protein